MKLNKTQEAYLINIGIQSILEKVMTHPNVAIDREPESRPWKNKVTRENKAPKKRTLSAAARKKISRAQKARWRKHFEKTAHTK